MVVVGVGVKEIPSFSILISCLGKYMLDKIIKLGVIF